MVSTVWDVYLPLVSRSQAIGDTHRVSGNSCCSEPPSRFHGSHDLRRNLRHGHMWLIVLYSPALVLLPIALIVGIFVVLFSAGLFILLGSVYLLVMVFRGWIEFRNRRQRHGPRRRLVVASSAPRSTRTGASATPALAALRSREAVRYESVRMGARPEQDIAA